MITPEQAKAIKYQIKSELIKKYMMNAKLPFFSTGRVQIDIAAGEEEVINFTLPSDTEFILEELQVQADNENGDSVHLGFKLQSSDDEVYTGESYVGMNYFSNAGSGHAEHEKHLNIPLRKATTLTLKIKNFAANDAENLIISAYGRKNRTGVSFFTDIDVVG